jgi:oxygen-independent coproporphyrinogen-3 oxidase
VTGRLTEPTLAALVASGSYLSYAYSYPHKTAYRPLAPARPLRELWADEDRSALFLYLHVPFCEQRCGFCNLFTEARPRGDLEDRYVAALERQAAVVAAALAPARFAQVAIGGGTPTYLSARHLERLLAIVGRLGAGGLPASVEVSPSTLDADKLAVLVAAGTTRVSMGVQSFVPAETAAVHRRQDLGDVERALGWLRDVVPVRNVDLIYGLPGQTAETLRGSIDRALALGANELYLYPLYVRPLTVLGRRGGWRDQRLALYRAGRDHLRQLGWRQASMRMFAAPGVGETGGGPRYRCQEDGMVGLGAGARSYTRALHYASPYAVAQKGVRAEIAAWVDRSDADHAVADHGFALDADEQRRRFVLLSLLDTGVDRRRYRERFGADVLVQLPALGEALDAGIAVADDDALRLTDAGVEHADVIGHWLQSAAVRARRDAWSAA